MAFAASTSQFRRKRKRATQLLDWLVFLQFCLLDRLGTLGLLILNYSDIIFLSATVCQDHVSVGIGVLAFQIAI